MKLSLLSESMFDDVARLFGPIANRIAVEPQDDTNCLVAYRLHHGTRVMGYWAISLNGHFLGLVSRKSQNWVGVSWDTSFATRHTLGPDFVQLMTTENRAYLEDMLKQLARNIARAMSARNAEVVRLPIDPAKL